MSRYPCFVSNASLTCSLLNYGVYSCFLTILSLYPPFQFDVTDLDKLVRLALIVNHFFIGPVACAS